MLIRLTPMTARASYGQGWVIFLHILRLSCRIGGPS
jgi:hypothetical protein